MCRSLGRRLLRSWITQQCWQLATTLVKWARLLPPIWWWRFRRRRSQALSRHDVSVGKHSPPDTNFNVVGVRSAVDGEEPEGTIAYKAFFGLLDDTAAQAFSLRMRQTRVDTSL